MKPVGLTDPRTGRRPWACLQLRQENRAATLYSMVGFQTRMKWGDQKRVFRLIPGLENAEFVRYGVIHRNTYIQSPQVLTDTLQMKAYPNVFFAGQITGVEGYVEAAATGILAGRNAARHLLGQPLLTVPDTTMLGALVNYVAHYDGKDFQPMNSNWGIVPPLPDRIRDKKRKECAAGRARSGGAGSRAVGMIEAACDAFLHSLETVRGLSLHTVKAYAEDLHQFVGFAETRGVTDIHAVDPALLRDFLIHLQSQNLARASRARKTASLRSFFDYLVKQSLLSRSPAADLRTVKTEKHLPKFLRSDEIDALLAAPDASKSLGLRDRALLETLYASGMRAGELVTLSVSDVDYDEGVIRVVGKGQKRARDAAGPSGGLCLAALPPQRPPGTAAVGN